MSERFTDEQAAGAMRFLRMVQLSANRQRLMPQASAFDPSRRSRVMGGASTHEGARRFSTVLGYSEELDFGSYLWLYERGGLAGQIIDVRADDSWGQPPAVTENDEEDTEFVSAWNELVERHYIWDVLRRADAASGIGNYGALMFGLAGNADLSKPVEKGSVKGPEGLLWLRPLNEGQAKIGDVDDDPSSKRCGYPLNYDVQVGEDSRERVHYTRMLHIAEFRTDSEVYGRPWLKRPYDTLIDMLYKTLGGSAESAWLNQRKGAVLSPREGWDFDLGDAKVVDGFKDQLEAYVHDLARFLFAPGMDVAELGGSDVWDPTGLFNAFMKHIAAITRIPMHVLFGSAAGELASSQEDTRRWSGVIARRQNTYVEPRILRPFSDRLIWYGVLPEPADGYKIGKADDEGNRHWPPLIPPDEEQAATISMRKATAMKQFADAEGATPFTKKEQRAVVGFPPDIPEDMEDDEPEAPAMPEAPVEQPGADEPEQPTEPEIVEPPSEEPDEETERARANEDYIASLFIGSHKPVIVDSTCPLCGFVKAERYEGHGPLLRCANPDCRKTYDPTVEGVGYIVAQSGKGPGRGWWGPSKGGTHGAGKGGSGGLSPIAEEAIQRAEGYIRSSPTEHAGLFDPETGKELLAKSGGASSVSFTDKEVAQMSGKVLTHNHPTGRSFSESDIRLLTDGKLMSIRAAGSTGKTYIMSRSEKTPTWKDIKPKVDIVDDQVRGHFMARIFDKKTTTSAANMLHNHEVWERLTKNHPGLGLTYEVIE